MAQIAWLGKKSPFCGNVSYGVSITEALRQRGHQIKFIHFDNTRRSKESRNLFFANDPDVSLPYLLKSQIYTIPLPRALNDLKNSLKQIRPDILHASLTLSPLDFRLPEICQNIGLPLVVTFHPAFDARLRNFTASTQQLTYQLYAPSLARCDRVIVFSKLQEKVLERLGVPLERLAVIPNGVDTDLWAPAANNCDTLLHRDIQQKLGKERIFLYMGRISTEKNVESLLRAWRLVSPVGCRLVIVGDGPLRSKLDKKFKDTRAFWWGDEPDLKTRVALLQCAEVFLLPSLVEGLSLALLEAMASGTACIATDAGADGEVLEDGAGILMSTQDVTKQLKSIIPLLRDQPILTAELGRKGRQRVQERYTLSRNIEALEQLYSSLIEKSQIAA